MLKGIKKVLIDIFNLFYKVIYGYARWVLAVVIVIICAQVFWEHTADQYPLEPGGGAAAYNLDGVPGHCYWCGKEPAYWRGAVL